MLMRMKLVQRRDEIIDGVNACPTFLVPPLIASPDFLLDFIVRSFHILLKHKRLAQEQELSLPTSRLRVTCN